MPSRSGKKTNFWTNVGWVIVAIIVLICAIGIFYFFSYRPRVQQAEAYNEREHLHNYSRPGDREDSNRRDGSYPTDGNRRETVIEVDEPEVSYLDRIAELQAARKVHSAELAAKVAETNVVPSVAEKITVIDEPAAKAVKWSQQAINQSHQEVVDKIADEPVVEFAAPPRKDIASTAASDSDGYPLWMD